MLAGGWRLLADGCELLAPCIGSRLKIQGSRLKAQGSRLKAQGSRLKAQGSRLKAQSSAIREGERDYSEQTLATLAFQRMTVFRGVVNMVLVNVKMQCVKLRFFCEKQKGCFYHHQNHICAQQSKFRFCTSVFCEGQDRIPQNYKFGFDRTMTCE